MARSRHRLKALGLCALALGLIAVGISSSHAEVGSNWMVVNNNIPKTLLPSIQVKEIEKENEGILETEILGVGVKVLCSTAELIGMKLETEGKITSGGKIKYAGCETFLNGGLAAACLPKSHAGVNDIIETTALKALIKLHNNAGTVLIEPVVGEILAKILTGEECAVGPTITIIGKYSAIDINGKFAVEEVTHLVTQGQLSEMWANTKTEEHEVALRGGVVVQLSGVEHSNKKWSGLPN